MSDLGDDVTLEIKSKADDLDKTLDSVISNLETMSSTLRGIDASGLSQLTIALKDFNKEVNSLTIDKAMQGMENSVNKTSKKMANDLANAFGITDSKAIRNIEEMAKELNTAISKYAQTGNFDVDIGLYQNLIKSVEDGTKTVRAYDSEMQQLLKTVQSVSKIKISPEAMSSLGDSWKNLDGMLKQKLSTTKGTELDSLIQEWKEKFNGVFDSVGDDFNLNNVEDQIRALDQILDQARNGIQLYGTDTQEIWNQIVQASDKAIVAFKRVNEQAKNTNGTNQVGFDTTTLKEIVSIVGGISTKGVSNLEKIKNSLVDFVNGLNSTGSINFNTESLKQVFNAINTLSKESSTSAADNLKSVSGTLKSAVEELNSVPTIVFDSAGLVTFANSINMLGRKTTGKALTNLPSLTTSLRNFITELNTLGAVNFDTTNLVEVTNAITRLGSVASGRAIDNLPILAANLKSLFTTLSTAPQVSSNIIQMTTALANLASSGSKAGTAANSLSAGLNVFSTSSTKATKKAFSLAAAFGKFYATYWLVLRAFNKLSDAIDISSDLTEVQNVVDVTFGEMSSKVEQFTQNSIQQFGMSELAAKQYASRFQAMGTAMGIDSSLINNANSWLNKQTNGYVDLSNSMSDVSLTLTKLTADMASFYNLDQADVAEDLEAIFTGQTRPLRLVA